jgi:uncharacterized protein (DUF2237 family)
MSVRLYITVVMRKHCYTSGGKDLGAHVSVAHIICYMYIVQWQSSHVNDVNLANT